MNIRARHILYIVGLVLIPMLFVLTDPDMGLITDTGPFATMINYAVYTLRIFLVYVVAHLGRKLLFDYPEADFRSLISTAIDQNGAGQAAIAVSVMFLSICMLVLGVLLT